jgi:hypothetical protein
VNEIVFPGEHTAAVCTQGEGIRTVAAGPRPMAAIVPLPDGLQFGAAAA